MRKLLTGAAGTLVVLAIAIPALAATQATDFTAKLTSKNTSSSAGLDFSVKFTDDDGGKPEGLKRFTLTLPKGGKFDLRAAPKCVATAEEAEQLKPCPAKTQIGAGEATATSDGTNRVKVTSKLYNVKPLKKPKDPSSGEILFIFELGGEPVTGFAAVAKGRTLKSPALADFPLDFVVTDFEGAIEKNKKGKRVFITTPDTCPKSGKWEIKATFKFPSGTSKPVVKTPCKR